MKPSIIMTAITLIVAAAFGWHQHQQLVGLRAGNARLVEEVAAQGISRNGESSTRHRERQDQDALAAEVIAFAREGGKLLEDGVGPDAEATKRSVELMDRIMRLDASQLEDFLAEFRAEPAINELAREYMLMDCVLALSTKNPRAGLELLIHSPELLGEGSITQQYIGELLGNLAKDDPQGALEWIRANKEAHPDLVTDDLMGFFIAKVHPFEPETAMQWLETLPQGSDRSKALEAIYRGMQESQNYEKAAVEAFAREHGFSK